MTEDSIADVEEFCRSMYNEAVEIREHGYISQDHTLVPETVSPDVYSDFTAAYDNDLIAMVETYTAALTKARQRESVTSLVRLQDEEERLVHEVTAALDGIWRDDADPYSGLSDTVVSFVEEYADGF